MTTVILGDFPEVQMLIEQRRALGQDGPDEVWEDVYYVVPNASVHHGLLQLRLGRVLGDLAVRQGLSAIVAFNLGEPDDFRVPDLGVNGSMPDSLYLPSAALVVEILSPHDETFEKFDFYHRHGVREIMVADLKQKSIRVWRAGAEDEGYVETDYSEVLAAPVQDVAAAVVWPEASARR